MRGRVRRKGAIGRPTGVGRSPARTDTEDATDQARTDPDHIGRTIPR